MQLSPVITNSPPPPRLGRPRAFNRDSALNAAMRVFWAHGYEGASLTALTAAMCINRPSLYAAFGDKATLFRECVALYGIGPGRYLRRALGQPTARRVAESILRGVVAMATDPAHPSGCLWVQGALVTSDEGTPICREMATLRANGAAQVRERFARAQRDGELPATTSAEALAHYIITVRNGLAVQAAGGATQDQLNHVVDLALTAWPA